jgi:hypothetical protein
MVILMREKLMRLIASKPELLINLNTSITRLFKLAEYLIENGVTIPVRCKDCRNYDNSEGICWCKLNSKFYPGGYDWHSFPEDGYCSYGERRTDDI